MQNIYQITEALTQAVGVIRDQIADRVDKKFEDGSKISVYRMGPNTIRADIKIAEEE